MSPFLHTLHSSFRAWERRMRAGWQDLLVHPATVRAYKGRRETFQTLHELFRTFEGSNTPFSPSSQYARAWLCLVSSQSCHPRTQAKVCPSSSTSAESFFLMVGLRGLQNCSGDEIIYRVKHRGGPSRFKPLLTKNALWYLMNISKQHFAIFSTRGSCPSTYITG